MGDLPPVHPLTAVVFRRWLAKAILVVLTIALWLPTLAVVTTFLTVMATGCDVNEATAQPCLVAGHDIGETLYAGLVTVFLAGPTLPFAIGAVIVWFVVWRRAAAGRRNTP